jgi:uncharacterized protein
MKLQPDAFDVQSIAGYGPGWVGIANAEGGTKVTHSIVVGSRGENFAWNCARFEDLSQAHFDQLLACKPELIVFGSGNKLRFAPPALMRSLMAARIGVETMDTLAACRTYNILAGEGRHVLAALLIEA